MITKEIVNQAIDYIMEHLAEEITIEDVARHCHFSKFYFSRIFKAETGESVYAFIKRLKMTQSAIRLKVDKAKSITEIGLDYGYSPSNYSTVFRQHHRRSPAEFRKTLNPRQMPHPYDWQESVRFLSFAEYDQHIKIQEFDDFVVIFERHIGNYQELAANWAAFAAKYRGFFADDTLLIERSYDDPSITQIDQCLYDLCMTVDPACPLDNVMTISGGKFAVFRFEGAVKDIFGAFQGIFNIWLPGSSYKLDERYGLDIYRSVDCENLHVVMDLCVPVQ